MKNNRLSNHNKMPPRPGPGIGSLKAIMNQGRVPLSHYINQRPNKNAPIQPHQMPYFQKLKAMMQNGSRCQSLERDCGINRPQSSQKDEIKDQTKLKNYLQQYQGTGKISFNKEKGKEDFKGKEEYFRGKQRAKSVNRYLHNYPPTQKKLPPQQVPSKPTKAVTQQHRPQTQGDSLDPQVQPSLFSKFGKQVKRERVDYKRFEILLQGEQVRYLWLQQVLGCGANATVRAGRDGNSKEFAVKVYEKYKLIEPKRMKRVMQQIDILGQLNHPNIIKLMSCFQDKRQIHMLFEFVVGAKTLQELIRENGYNVPELQKKSIGIQVTQAIVYLHEMGISHRDIKTDNLIIGKGGQVKLIDFGFATSLTKGQAHCGTPNYMAPQLFQKKNIYSPAKVDSWALGVLLFYLHEGTYPFKGYSQKQLCRNIGAGNYNFSRTDGWTKKAIEGALTVDPLKRISVQEIFLLLKK